MTTYMIFLKEETVDAGLLDRCVEKGLTTVQRSAGTALAWYESPAYQEAAILRKDASRFTVMMVEGLAAEIVP